jgi:hypothetical protein
MKFEAAGKMYHCADAWRNFARRLPSRESSELRGGLW